MSTKNQVFRITLINFNKYNSSIKKGHKCTLISNNFCEDAKLINLPITTRWLFLNLILTCGDLCRDTIEVSSKVLRGMLECNRNIERELESLQYLQVLTFEKIDLFLNRIEEKRIEKNKIIIKENSENQNLEFGDEKKLTKEKIKFDFETAYSLYPRKEGKTEGISRLQKIIKTQIDYEFFILAVHNYSNHVRVKGIETQFVKLFSSFVGTEKCQTWRDYIDFQVEDSKEAKDKKWFDDCLNLISPNENEGVSHDAETVS